MLLPPSSFPPRFPPLVSLCQPPPPAPAPSTTCPHSTPLLLSSPLLSPSVFLQLSSHSSIHLIQSREDRIGRLVLRVQPVLGALCRIPSLFLLYLCLSVHAQHKKSRSLLATRTLYSPTQPASQPASSSSSSSSSLLKFSLPSFVRSPGSLRLLHFGATTYPLVILRRKVSARNIIPISLPSPPKNSFIYTHLQRRRRLHKLSVAQSFGFSFFGWLV